MTGPSSSCERNERAFLVLNKYPYNNGHLMAVPYHHADSLEKLMPEDVSGMMAMVERAVPCSPAQRCTPRASISA